MDFERLKLWRGRAVRPAPAGRMRDGGALQRDIAREVVSLLLGICFWREAPRAAVGPDRRAGKWGLAARNLLLEGGP